MLRYYYLDTEELNPIYILKFLTETVLERMEMVRLHFCEEKGDTIDRSINQPAKIEFFF